MKRGPIQTVITKSEEELKELYPPDKLRLDIAHLGKKELIKSNIIDPEIIKNSTKKSSSKRTTLSENSSCDFKKKKQDNNSSQAVTQETENSNGV